MAKKSSSAVPRYPPADHGIQVNFCRNPHCKNFGVLPATSVSRGRPSAGGSRETDTYTIVGSPAAALRCKLCGQSPILKSNKAILEELRRVGGYLTAPAKALRCPNDWCVTAFMPMQDHPDEYQEYGKTASGAQRYRCKGCGTTFSVPKSTAGQRQPHKNRDIFLMLMNKVAIRRICEIASVSPSTIYHRIDFLYKQCLAFVSQREQELLNGMQIPRLHVSVDRQDYIVNWSDRKEKKNVTLTSIGSADNKTGYVFGMHLNFDGALDPAAIEKDALQVGDYEAKLAARKYARLWLKKDYLDAVAAATVKTRLPPADQSSLTDRIETAYAEAMARADTEATDRQSEETQLPKAGMQVHFEYTAYGHFFLLSHLFRGVDKVRFYIDQDSALRASCLAAFCDRIKQRTADAYFVQIAKKLTNEQKQRRQGRVRKALRQAMKKYPNLTKEEVELLFVRMRMTKMRPMGKWGDLWLRHPFPRMDEPKKAVCHLTDFGDYTPEQAAKLYHRATLAGIDRFFMQVRRRIMALERPFKAPSRAGRTYYAYNAYNPEVIVKLLGIFRVYFNYVLVGEDGKTPAMRLGLARGPVQVEDIIYFTPY